MLPVVQKFLGRVFAHREQECPSAKGSVSREVKKTRKTGFYGPRMLSPGARQSHLPKSSGARQTHLPDKPPAHSHHQEEARHWHLEGRHPVHHRPYLTNPTFCGTRKIEELIHWEP
jgi:hypothetical protein